MVRCTDLSVADDVIPSLARPPQDTLFTFPSVYVLGPAAQTTCWHATALLSNVTKTCAPEAFQTGVNCDSPQCGRPADWPAGHPFFLPFDLQDPAVWLRLGCARPVLDHVTRKEKTHLGVRLHAHLHMRPCLRSYDAAQSDPRLASLHCGSRCSRSVRVHCDPRHGIV